MLNVDGQEWLRGKWGATARAVFRYSSKVSGRSATALVADCQAMADVFLEEFNSPSTVIPYCSPSISWSPDDAVLRGRMTRTDAQEMIQSLLSRGARATDDLLSDIERMLGTTGDALEDADAEKGTPVSPNLPIADYDELSAAQVQDRLDGLTAAELRKLRDYEQRHANRKTVLDRIERRLR